MSVKMQNHIKVVDIITTYIYLFIFILQITFYFMLSNSLSNFWLDYQITC